MFCNVYLQNNTLHKLRITANIYDPTNVILSCEFTFRLGYSIYGLKGSVNLVDNLAVSVFE